MTRDAEDEGEGRDLSRVANVVLIVTCLCAAVVTALVVRREVWPEAVETVEASAVERKEIEGWRELAEAGHAIGPPDADVLILSFADFQCPACRRVATSVRALRSRFPGRIRYVHRHFPLSSHPHARAAAHAAECAAAQSRFAAFHEVLFTDQEVIGAVPWSYFAQRAELPRPRHFAACLERPAPEVIARDRRVGEEIGVEGTPTLVVNGTRFDGAPPYAVLRDVVRRELGVTTASQVE